jgi:CO/xanthine dehydrogenase Mo-binding subunit
MKMAQVLGTSIPKKDALGKAAGTALYVADILRPGMLIGRAVRSPYAHAWVNGIDPSEALACPGVIAVYTASDIPGKNLTGPRTVKDQPVMTPNHVRFAGEAVALVVAESEAAALEGSRKVKVSYRPLPVVDDPEEALGPQAPLLHEGGNLCHQFRVVRGDFEAALRKADLVITRAYRTQMADHSALEPDGAVAERAGDGIVVWISSKGVHLDQGEIARVLGLPLQKVRVIAAAVGGSFGSKPDHPSACMAALIAWRTGRPARVVLDREECFLAKTKRHPYLLHYTHAVRRDGKILGVKVRATADAGAYSSYTPTVAARGLIHAPGPYAIDHVDLEVRAAYTNHPIAGAFRGYGEPQYAFAVESQMDLIARELGLDPWEIRMKNALREGDQLSTGQVVNHVKLRDILEAGRRAAEELDQQDRMRGQLEAGPRFLRSWGISTCFYGLGRTGMADKAEVTLRLEEDGHFHLGVGCSDVGQGSDTCMRQIAAQELGVPSHLVRITSADTLSTRDAGTTTATRVTYVVGNAVKNAAATLKERLLSGGEEKVLIGDAGWLADLASFCRSRGVDMECVGSYVTSNSQLNEEGQGDPYGTYTFGAQWTRACIDTWTWKISVERIVSCYDLGHVINPVLVEGQIEGGAAMALGYGLTEEVRLREGVILNQNFGGYILPTAADVPPVTKVILETGNPEGPFGATGIGEITTVPGAASLANAVSTALGVEVRELPLTPERLYALVASKNQGEESVPPSPR